MNNQETTALCRYVRALCPQQRFDEYTPDAWHDLLGDQQLADAREAAARIARRQPFVAPSEILAEIRKIRSERLVGFEYVPMDADEDPRTYLANLRAQRAAVAAGRRPAAPARPALPAAPDRDVAELVGGSIGRTVPNHDEPEPPKPGSPLSVPCPTCTARTGHHCRMRLGIRRTVHPTRARVAAGLPSYNPADQAEAERRRAASAAALANLTPAERAQLAAHIHAQQQEAS